MQAFLFTALFSFIFLLLQVFVDVRYSFVSDPLVKAIQIESLKIQNYTTQEIFYPARDLDKKAEFQPTPRGFIFCLNGKIYSPFPISFAFLYSFLPIPLENLFFTNFVLLFLLLFFNKKFLNLNWLSLGFLLFGTVIFPISFDLSENPLFLLLTGIGFVFFVRFLELKDKKFFIYSSIFLGLAIWLRLEALIIYSCLVCSLMSFIFTKKIQITVRELELGVFFFLVIFLLFNLFNYISYGVALGPRYLVNFQDSVDVIEKIKIFTDIVFTRIEYGVPKFGFFFYSPILLFTLILMLWKFRDLQVKHQIIITFSVFLIFGIGLSAPNNGISVTGRYLSGLVFPLVYLLSENWNLIFQTGVKKIFPAILIVWSILISLISLTTLKFSFMKVKEFQKYFQNIDTNMWVFTSRASSGFIGLEYFKRKVLGIESEKEVEQFIKILNEHKPSNFTLFCLDSNFVKQTKIYQHDVSKLLIKLSNEKYSCTEKETFQQIIRFECLKQL